MLAASTETDVGCDTRTTRAAQLSPSLDDLCVASHENHGDGGGGDGDCGLLNDGMYCFSWTQRVATFHQRSCVQGAPETLLRWGAPCCACYFYSCSQHDPQNSTHGFHG